MAWEVKTKIPQQGDDEEILTPDGQQILVGASEDQVLLYQIAFSNWGLKSKQAGGNWNLKGKQTGNWSLKTKITV